MVARLCLTLTYAAINARKLFSELKERHANNPNKMTKYCHPLPPPLETSDNALHAHRTNVLDHETTSGILRTICNDYELMALGIRMNIVDEKFAYRYMRGALLNDWRSVNPIATAYRAKYNNNLLYIEFEGLVNSWEQGKSYLNDRAIKAAKKRIQFN